MLTGGIVPVPVEEKVLNSAGAVQPGPLLHHLLSVLSFNMRTNTLPGLQVLCSGLAGVNWQALRTLFIVTTALLLKPKHKQATRLTPPHSLPPPMCPSTVPA